MRFLRMSSVQTAACLTLLLIASAVANAAPAAQPQAAGSPVTVGPSESPGRETDHAAWAKSAFGLSGELHSRASLPVQAWVREEAARQVRGMPSSANVASDARGRFGDGLPDADVSRLSVMVMAEVAHQADQDVYFQLMGFPWYQRRMADMVDSHEAITANTNLIQLRIAQLRAQKSAAGSQEAALEDAKMDTKALQAAERTFPDSQIRACRADRCARGSGCVRQLGKCPESHAVRLRPGATAALAGGHGTPPEGDGGAG